MPFDKERREIIRIGQMMYQRGFVASNDGNLSVRLPDGNILITPSGVSKGFMTEEMLLVCTLRGDILSGDRPITSEAGMHLRAYQENPDIKAVCHAHPKVATSFACAGIPLTQPILAEAVVQLGEVPVAPYATPGSSGVADSVAPYLHEHVAVLLANHGALTWGRSLNQAYFRMESLEFYAEVLLNTKIIGQQCTLPPEEVQRLVQLR